jgi:hypothetical protein
MEELTSKHNIVYPGSKASTEKQRLENAIFPGATACKRHSSQWTAEKWSSAFNSGFEDVVNASSSCCIGYMLLSCLENSNSHDADGRLQFEGQSR